MPPGVSTYDPTWGAEIQSPGGWAFHFQEYIDARPGAMIGFDIGSDAIGFTSFEYEIPPLDEFEVIELPW